ncbi:hypothetical protein [Pseudoalteromonas phenolica]|uniref:Uncharacterized protein n=1 Tax=Pseudoalteromonas phenolica TaxID=161398 RepID=A0A0S2JZH7_9GAMM|nr:hypothetical protein [Pseudoalteromonas phenolica]ALO41166.1 hypothetical protein PP2015_646 [Pseudoalteromonas phenolica]MBE0354301.1 hypothetical protein [Pseudoalteromonas phenolica O-BC30]RXE92275.1 hypothetical protein D9981_21695 [Pseudoalteromonas phenolica O-BC30]TMO57666.1 hypothetical protein CWC21_02185 [Pseudoalteromonas phenolica]|tara:strand:+ start:2156 stop:2335 length:180 start_codon:yes stop_codon:yes gene_type:complete
MKLQIKKQSLKQLSQKSLSNEQTAKIAAGYFTPDPQSWLVCPTHPALCQSAQITQCWEG